MTALGGIARWPTVAAAGVTAGDPGQPVERVGPPDQVFAWASVTKLVTALAVWVAVEEGTVDWDDPAGPPGASLAHLLSHASGVGPDSDQVLVPPATRRIYSNRGIELAAGVVARSAGMSFADYATEAVIGPLGLSGTTIDGSPAHGATGPLTDLLRLAAELLAPTLVAPATRDRATSVAFPGLAGVLPGFGPQNPNDWGLGPEIRGAKHPHWTGHRNSAATYGHFGRSGSFLWVDPVAGVAAASLAEAPFGPWAAAAWPALADAVIDAYGAGSTGS